MKEKQNAALGTAPLGRLMLKFALPCTVSLLVVPLRQSRRNTVLRTPSYLHKFFIFKRELARHSCV